jgi:YHS domain-containing protein
MYRLIILVFLIYILYRLVKGFFIKDRKVFRKGGASGLISEMVQDPFCKTYIPRNEAYRKVLGGKEIFFCSRECAEKFELENKF